MHLVYRQWLSDEALSIALGRLMVTGQRAMPSAGGRVKSRYLRIRLAATG